MNEGAVLIDVRSASEYAESHLDNSINLTVDTIGVNIEKLVSDKNTKIIVYCRSGNRSATAAEIPISILTAFIGAPFFIILLRKTGGIH